MNTKVEEQQTLDEAFLIDKILKGQVELFEVLINRYEKLVFWKLSRHAPHHEVEDLAQDVFLKSYTHLKSLKKTGSLKAWLMTTSVRVAYDYWRRNETTKQETLNDDDLDLKIAHITEKQHQQNSIQENIYETIEDALAQLNAQERLLVQLIYLENYSILEAAKILSMSTSNAKVKLHRTRKKLSPLLKSLSNDSK